MPSLRSSLSLALILLSLLAVTLVPAGAQGQRRDPAYIWQVVVDDQADIDALVNGGWDLVEARGDDHLLVVGTVAVANALRAEGFAIRLDRQLPEPELLVDADGDITTRAFYGGYRSFDEHVTHLNDVAAAFPDLTTLYDYGDSWRKQQGRTDNDLLAICITNKQPGDCALNPNSAKPRAVIMSAIHARELQTAEVSWRLIDDLVIRYGDDADITHILDTTEVWIIPVVNPDGREIVESGANSPYMQRKNGNDTLGDCELPATPYNHHGVDLNRNATWGWGGAGTTTDPCAQTYRGTEPASEPEQAALEALFDQLWPDNKGPNWDDPVDADTTGSFITIHSYGNLILLPGGEGDDVSPNDTEVRAFGFRMAHWNNYVVGTGQEILYGASGTTDDHVYYKLGVPSFTYELSPRSGSCSGFAPPYSCVDSEIWPLNRDALIYSMKVAGSPYSMPLGPTVLSVTAPETIAAGAPLTISAAIDDDAYGNAAGSYSRPAAEAVDAVQYWIDTLPGDQEGAPMAAADGAFDESGEAATVTISESLSPGKHTVYVQARNAGGDWGPVTATSFEVTAALGDVDGDGGIDMADVLAILTHVAADPDDPSMAAADMNSDGRISLLDALLLARQVRAAEAAAAAAEDG